MNQNYNLQGKFNGMVLKSHKLFQMQISIAEKHCTLKLQNTEKNTEKLKVWCPALEVG